MNFTEVIVLPCFEEELSLVSEDLTVCVNTAFALTHHSKASC